MTVKSNHWLSLLGSLAVLLIALAMWVGASAMEARTFNKLTGAETTYIDAMFSRLRVTGEAR